jgi:4-hydroxybenzoate polyprenyltransferase
MDPADPIRKIVADWAGLSRWRGWATSKLPFIGAASLLLTAADSSASLTLMIMATVLFWAAFGYGVNDVADQRQDQRAGKPNRAAQLSGASSSAFLLLTAGLAVATSLVWAKDAAGPILVLAGLLLAASYSLPPIRLKERGAIGLVAGAVAQWSLPVLAVSAARPRGWWAVDAWSFALWGLAIGLRWMAIHQLHDAAADRKAAVRTYASRGGRVWRVILGAILGESGFLALTLWLTWPRSLPAVLALAVWVAQQAALRPRGESLRSRLQDYRQAPLAEYYFLLLPVGLALGRGLSSPGLLWLIPAFLVLGSGYLDRMLSFRLRQRLLRGASSPWR